MDRMSLSFAAAMLALGAAPQRAMAQQGGVVELPPVEIVSTTPVAGGEQPLAQVPGTVQTIPASDIAEHHDVGVSEGLARNNASVTITETSGNSFQPDVSYRGFTASPVAGTPQGLAVYQNGVRINESYGDNVNWDLIPANGIDQTVLISNNPAFGLNALGGAVNVTMKNGFTWQGQQVDVQGGSYGRRQLSLQFGKQIDNWALYVAGEGLNDDGWRQYSPSQVRRVYADLGYKGDKAELHFTFTGASNSFGASGPAPIELLANNYASVYTTPQSTSNQLAFFTLSGAYEVSKTLSFQSNIYYRNFNQQHADGNTTQVTSCAPFSCLNGNLVNDRLGNPIPDISNNGAVDLGEIDRYWTRTRSAGLNLQGVESEKLLGFDNHLTFGVSLDRGWTNFQGNSELGTIASNLFVNGSGYLINEPDAYLAPVGLNATNSYVGVYALDTFNVTKELAITGGGRFNFANINLSDQLGTALTSNSDYARFNPVIGGTYQFTPDFSGYVGYSEANRAPTPLELGCASPTTPCVISNFLVSDPPLQQVVSRTVEAGFRGHYDGGDYGKVDWNAGVFRARNANDILPFQLPQQSFGYYANVGDTMRQGVELGAVWKKDIFSAFVNYSYIQATYQTAFNDPAPNNPNAVNGTIPITPGTPLAGVPANRLKAGFDVAVSPQWKIGADWALISSQRLFTDEIGSVAVLGGYGIVNMHTSFQVTDKVQVYLLAQNLFNRQYYANGTLFDTGAIVQAATFNNPLTLSPGAPLAVYAGVKVSF